MVHWLDLLLYMSQISHKPSVKSCEDISMYNVQKINKLRYQWWTCHSLDNANRAVWCRMSRPHATSWSLKVWSETCTPAAYGYTLTLVLLVGCCPSIATSTSVRATDGLPVFCSCSWDCAVWHSKPWMHTNGMPSWKSRTTCANWMGCSFHLSSSSDEEEEEEKSNCPWLPHAQPFSSGGSSCFTLCYVTPGKCSVHAIEQCVHMNSVVKNIVALLSWFTVVKLHLTHLDLKLHHNPV